MVKSFPNHFGQLRAGTVVGPWPTSGWLHFINTAFINMQQGQDWETVIIRKKPVGGAAGKSETAVNDARRNGVAVDTVKKCESIRQR